jgi:hypothetical protein
MDVFLGLVGDWDVCVAGGGLCGGLAVECRTEKDLEADMGEILINFWTKYKFDFLAANLLLNHE